MSIEKIKVSELVEALDMQSDDITYYFNLSKNQLIFVMNNFEGESEENDELIETIKCNPEEYIALPSLRVINEYQIMVNFANEQEQEIKSKLINTLNGKGAFSKFKDEIFELDIRDEWFKFKNEELEIIALDWCRENNLLDKFEMNV